MTETQTKRKKGVRVSLRAFSRNEENVEQRYDMTFQSKTYIWKLTFVEKYCTHKVFSLRR